VEEHTTIAVDLSKSVFEVAVSRESGRVCERRRLSRSQLRRFFSQRPSNWRDSRGQALALGANTKSNKARSDPSGALSTVNTRASLNRESCALSGSPGK